MNFLAVRLEHVDSVAKTNILPGLLVCPRFFHLHRLYFSPRRLNPPPQRACDRPGELLHSAWSPSSNAAFTTSILGNAGLWQTDSESSPLASEPFRRFIIQSGSSSKCVLFPPPCCSRTNTDLSRRGDLPATEPPSSNKRDLYRGKKSVLLWCLTQAANSFAARRRQPDCRVVLWVYRCWLSWWHDLQCTTPSGQQRPNCLLCLVNIWHLQ